MKAISPVVATLILIAIAVIAGVFVLRQFLSMAGGATSQQYLQIVDLYITRRETAPGKFSIDITIGVKNSGDKRITVDSIIVPDAQWNVTKLNINLNPGETWQGSFNVLVDQPYIVDNIDWHNLWRKGTEHVVIVRYYVVGDPQYREISQKGMVV